MHDLVTVASADFLKRASPTSTQLYFKSMIMHIVYIDMPNSKNSVLTQLNKCEEHTNIGSIRYALVSITITDYIFPYPSF